MLLQESMTSPYSGDINVKQHAVCDLVYFKGLGGCQRSLFFQGDRLCVELLGPIQVPQDGEFCVGGEGEEKSAIL